MPVGPWNTDGLIVLPDTLSAERLLRQIRPGSSEYSEAERLLAALDWFLPAPVEFIPDNSILREFIGSSSLLKFGKVT